jgi:Arc/MetJ family transcription regulator
VARLTVTVDPELIEEVRRLAKASSKREALEVALREYTRRKRQEELADLAESDLVTMSRDELDRWRAVSPVKP